MISHKEVFSIQCYMLLKHAGLTPQQFWTKTMTMWPHQILFVFVLYHKISISFCGKSFTFSINLEFMMRNWCYVTGFMYSEISVVWCFVFICYFILFFLQSRHMNTYFSNLAVYYAWVSQLVSYLLPVERWIFVNPWLPARSCLQLMSSLVVFSFWCVLEGDSIFKTTFLSSTVAQGIISLSFSPSPQHDCFKYFFHDSSLPKLFSKYKNITFKCSPNCYSKPEKCSIPPFWLFSDCFSSF